MEKKPIIVAMTGASGALYGLRLIECLLANGRRVDWLISAAARIVLVQECGLDLQGDGQTLVEALQRFLPHLSQECNWESLRHYALHDWMAPVASGSAGKSDMVICPCSMGTLAAVCRGLSDNLIERAADVVIKEGGGLILVPRETPFSPIHLENMLSLARLGVVIMPAAPGFYHRPQHIAELIDFMVARILDRLGIPHQLMAPWSSACAVESLG